MLHHHRLRMREVPVQMYTRGGGISSIGTGKSAYYMIKVLLALIVGLARRLRSSIPAIARRWRPSEGSDGRRIQLVAILGAGVCCSWSRACSTPPPDGALRPAVAAVGGGAAWLAACRERPPRLSKAIGIIYPPNALFFIALGFILVLLLHFSAAVSRLTDQSKVLAQRVALLEERLRRSEEWPALDADSRIESEHRRFARTPDD